VYTTLLFVLLLLAVVWLVVRVRRNKAEVLADKQPRKASPHGVFHAVSLEYSAEGCTAAKEMTGRRFLSSAAPQLPLPGCDSLECFCKFVHHADRRNPTDRRSPFGSAGAAVGTGSFQRERRELMERRKPPDRYRS
jgi:hypothetical protein